MKVIYTGGHDEVRAKVDALFMKYPSYAHGTRMEYCRYTANCSRLHVVMSYREEREPFRGRG